MRNQISTRLGVRQHILFLIAIMSGLMTACGGGGSSNSTMPSSGGGGGYGGGGGTPPPGGTTANDYVATSLVSDGSVKATTTDNSLKNPWGIALAPNAAAVVADQVTQQATSYDGNGVKQSTVIAIPAGLGGAADPSGVVANTTSGFVITSGSASAPAQYIFDGEGGTIAAWATSVNAQNAITMYDGSSSGAIYTGLAIATDSSGVTRLYAADFGTGKVDVFDSTFAKTTVSGGFTDSMLPTGYAPFGIQALTVNGQSLIYVAYAKPTSQGSRFALTGAGLGLVDVFNTQGTLQTHLIGAGGHLNAPWGITMAPSNFGPVSGDLLIGNFGDGTIDAYNPSSGTFVDQLATTSGMVIANSSLWGIEFGNGAANQPTNTLYFAAGIGGGMDGLYGSITVAP